MKNTLGGIKTVAAALLAMCALQVVGADRVTKARLGDLRRDDRVVVDVGSVAEDPVVSVNGQTGTVHLVAADVGAATMQDVADFAATNVAESVSNLADALASQSNMLSSVAALTGSNTHDVAVLTATCGSLRQRDDYITYKLNTLGSNVSVYVSTLWTYATNNYAIATNNYIAAWLANDRASRLAEWAGSVSNRLLLADEPADSLKRSKYFTTNNSQLVTAVSAVTRNHITYIGDRAVPHFGTYLAARDVSVVSTNAAGEVATNSYKAVSLYSDGEKVWTSDPLDSTNYGWLVALVLALVGSAGGVLWRYVAKSSASAAVSDVERALDAIISGQVIPPPPAESDSPVPGGVVGPGGTQEGNP